MLGSYADTPRLWVWATYMVMSARCSKVVASLLTGSQHHAGLHVQIESLDAERGLQRRPAPDGDRVFDRVDLRREIANSSPPSRATVSTSRRLALSRGPGVVHRVVHRLGPLDAQQAMLAGHRDERRREHQPEEENQWSEASRDDF